MLSLAPCGTYAFLAGFRGLIRRSRSGTIAAEVSGVFLDIKDLEVRPREFEEEFQPGVIDLGADVRQRTPLKTSGHAELVEEHHGKHEVVQDIRLRGRLSAGLELQCARCLEPVRQDVSRQFELLYRPLGADAGRDELSVTDAEAEIGYYQGEGVLLEDVLREQVLLALPLKTVCREDCKGLCPLCGKNLNQEQCSCEVPLDDPRWAALKDIRSRLG
jgi:uncharacterized protein